MTEAEYWDLNDRSWFSTEAQEVVRYVRRLPSFGGVWIDQRHGGRLAVALTNADPEVIATIDAKLPTEPDLGWRLVIVPRTFQELKAAANRAWKVSQELDPTAKLWSVGLDSKNGRIRVMYDPDDVGRMRPRKDELEKELGVPVVITSGRVREV